MMTVTMSRSTGQEKHIYSKHSVVEFDCYILILYGVDKLRMVTQNYCRFTLKIYKNNTVLFIFFRESFYVVLIIINS